MMKTAFENWRAFVKEKTFAELDPPINTWEKVPTKDLQHKDPENTDLSDQLFDLISKSYSSIGGHIDFKSPDDLPGNHTDWEAIDTDGDGEPEAVKFGKVSTAGEKMTGGGSDGSTAGKQAYVQRTAELLNKPGYYGELSDAIAHVMITRFKPPYVNNKEDVEKILGKHVKWIGKRPDGKYPEYAGWYSRELGGAEHMKIMFGRPKGVKVVEPGVTNITENWNRFLTEQEETPEKHSKYGDWDYFHRNHIKPQGKHPEQKPWKEEEFQIKKLGKIGDFEIWIVDGTAIRNRVDDDWVAGGNPARDIFIPPFQIWLEEGTRENDIAPYIIHEYTEYYAMLDGMSYDTAHENIANKYEIDLRDEQAEWEGEDPIEVAEKFLKDYKVKYKKTLTEMKVKIKQGLQLSRRTLPQIPSERIEEFISSLKDHGVPVIKTRVGVKELKPIQKKIDLKKVAKFSERGYKSLSLEKPIITTSDKYILDGHYRAWALRSIDRNADISCHEIQMPVSEFLEQMETFLPTFFEKEEMSNSTPEVGMAELFQSSLAKHEPAMKKKLIGLGGNKTPAGPDMEKPSYKRSKSAPPGFEENLKEMDAEESRWKNSKMLGLGFQRG